MSSAVHPICLTVVAQAPPLLLPPSRLGQCRKTTTPRLGEICCHTAREVSRNLEMERRMVLSSPVPPQRSIPSQLNKIKIKVIIHVLVTFPSYSPSRIIRNHIKQPPSSPQQTLNPSTFFHHVYLEVFLQVSRNEERKNWRRTCSGRCKILDTGQRSVEENRNPTVAVWEYGQTEAEGRGQKGLGGKAERNQAADCTRNCIFFAFSSHAIPSTHRSCS